MNRENEKRYNGTERENDVLVGAAGEVSYDRTNGAVRLHDGRTRGGQSVAVMRNRTEITEVDVVVQRTFLGAAATVLAKALTDGDTSIVVMKDVLTSGDIIFIERDGDIEWLAVTSGATAVDNYFSYSVTRDLASTGAIEFVAGTGVANTGQTGDIFVDIHAHDALMGEGGPGITIYRRSSSTYNDLEPIIRLGELDGSHGYSSPTFGAAIGRVHASGSVPWITFDEGQGLRIANSDGLILEVSEDGALNVGDPATPEHTAGRARFKKAVNFGDPSTPATADGDFAAANDARIERDAHVIRALNVGNPTTPVTQGGHIKGTGPVVLIIERGSNFTAAIEYRNNEGSLYAGLSDEEGWGVSTATDISGAGTLFFISGDGDLQIKRALNVGAPASPSTIQGDIKAKNNLYSDAQAAAAGAEIVEITSAGLLRKSGAFTSDFAASGHNHDSDYEPINPLSGLINLDGGTAYTNDELRDKIIEIIGALS